MSKKHFVLMLLLMVATPGLAQQVKMQGVPRQSVRVAQSTPATVMPAVEFDKIQYSVGSGRNHAAFVVKWSDGKGNDKNLVWGYRFNKATGEQMIRDIAAADPRFYALVYGETQFGAAIGGMGFDLDNDNDIALENKGERHTSTDGVFATQEYDFDNWTATDEADHWCAGWYNGYWSYWTTNSPSQEFEYSGVGASSRELANKCIDGWAFMADMTNWYSNDMSGELEYVQDPSRQEDPEQQAVDYTKGVFILNEDWYGHQNSTLNFLTDEGEWVYRVVQKENEGVELGATAQYGTIYGGRFYIMSKQDQDPGASIQGARLSVFDAKTMKMIKQFPTLGEEGGDGRGFLGVSPDKAYVGTNKGIRVLDLQTLEFTGSVTGSDNDEADGSYGSLYNAQVGNMVRVGDRVFAIHQKLGLMVINPETDHIDQVITGTDGELFSSVVAGADGNLWLSVGTGMPENKLGKLNPHTLELEFIDLPEGTYGPANSWYAWTPDGFCASRQHNVLYWNGGSSSWFTGKTIYRYDIDKNECTLMLDFNNDPDGWQQYGCSFRVDPVTDCIYTSLYKAFGDPSYVLRKYSGEGELLAEYPMITNYWFPSLPIFPDNADPVVAGLDDVRINDARQIPLAGVVTDADNQDMLIVKRVKEVSDAEVLTAEVKADSLILTPLKNGQATVTLQFNSNGKVAEASLNVTIEGIADGVNDVRGTSVVVSMTDLSGRAISGKGGQRIVIQRMSDGTTRKVMR